MRWKKGVIADEGSRGFNRKEVLGRRREEKVEDKEVEGIVEGENEVVPLG